MELNGGEPQLVAWASGAYGTLMAPLCNVRLKSALDGLMVLVGNNEGSGKYVEWHCFDVTEEEAAEILANSDTGIIN